VTPYISNGVKKGIEASGGRKERRHAHLRLPIPSRRFIPRVFYSQWEICQVYVNTGDILNCV